MKNRTGKAAVAVAIAGSIALGIQVAPAVQAAPGDKTEAVKSEWSKDGYNARVDKTLKDLQRIVDQSENGSIDANIANWKREVEIKAKNFNSRLDKGEDVSFIEGFQYLDGVVAQARKLDLETAKQEALANNDPWAKEKIQRDMVNDKKKAEEDARIARHKKAADNYKTAVEKAAAKEAAEKEAAEKAAQEAAEKAAQEAAEKAAQEAAEKAAQEAAEKAEKEAAEKAEKEAAEKAEKEAAEKEAAEKSQGRTSSIGRLQIGLSSK